MKSLAASVRLARMNLSELRATQGPRSFVDLFGFLLNSYFKFAIALLLAIDVIIFIKIRQIIFIKKLIKVSYIFVVTSP